MPENVKRAYTDRRALRQWLGGGGGPRWGQPGPHSYTYMSVQQRMMTALLEEPAAAAGTGSAWQDWGAGGDWQDWSSGNSAGNDDWQQWWSSGDGIGWHGQWHSADWGNNGNYAAASESNGDDVEDNDEDTGDGDSEGGDEGDSVHEE